MKRIIIIITAALLAVCPLSVRAQGLKRMGGSFLEPLEQRDSILIADQLSYGFMLDDVEEGTQFGFQDYSEVFGDTLAVVRNWQIDTLSASRKGRKSSVPAKFKIRGNVIIAPFEAGHYILPEIAVLRQTPDGQTDTLVFDAQEMDVTTIQIDTATFQIHDIKDQFRYPLTAAEVIPYVAAALVLAALVTLLVILVRRRRARRLGENAHKDPPYIVALRRLDHFRGDKYWAPDKQKTFYSGITDTLREYMAGTFDIDACEMTTAEIFDALKGNERIASDLYSETKELFELADFVKFAKHTVDNDDNARALPAAVRFVTATYQETIGQESVNNEKKEAE